MNFGKIEKIVLVGGGTLLLETVRIIKSLSLPSLVITSPRQIHDELEPGKTLLTLLKDLNVPQILCQDMNTDLKWSGQVNARTLGIALGPAWIFKKQVLDVFQGRLLNFYPVRLPAYRGGAHYTWQILTNDKKAACVLQQMTEKVNAGPVISYETYLFPSSARIPKDYYKAALQEEIRFLKRFLEIVIQSGDFQESFLQENFSTYFPRLYTKIHGAINWNWPTIELERFICAFDEPYPGAFTYLDGKRVSLKECRSDFNDGAFHPFQCGLVFRKTEDAVFVATLNGTLIIEKVLVEDGNDIKKEIRLGARFFTPSRDIEESMTFNAVYTGAGLKR